MIAMLLSFLMATTPQAQSDVHRIEVMTPNSGETCTFTVERRGEIGRRASLWQNDVIHRKIANRDDLVDPVDWADGIERLHGPAAYRMRVVGRCSATHVVVYADTPAAADLRRLDDFADVRTQRCVPHAMMAPNRRHNASLRMPTGITVVFALLEKETDGRYESVTTSYWDRKIPKRMADADRSCPPPLDQLPPIPPPVH